MIRVALATGSIMLACAGCGRIAFDPSSSRDAATADAPLDADERAWWDPAWRRRMKLAFDHPGPGLDNFPVLVRLDPTRFDYATRPAGQDVRFVDADGITLLAHDVESWTPGGPSYLWVNVPRVDATSTDDHIWLYYDNPLADDVENAAETWAGHALVWHLADDPAGSAPQIRDQSGNNNAGTSAGSMPGTARTSGAVGGALAFDGVDDWLGAPSTPSLALRGDLTISLWVNRVVDEEVWLVDFVTPESESEVNNHLYELAIDNSGPIEMNWEYGAGNDTDVLSSDPITSGLGTWFLLAVTRDTALNEVRFYENGAPLGTAKTYVEDATGGTASTFWVAGQPDFSGAKAPVEGSLDEVRIAGVVRSPEWLAAEHRSMVDMMIDYGAPETY